MTKEDFIILRNSITMMQVVNHYGFPMTHKGGKYFIRCPFHGNGSERTPSLQIYDGFGGFYCRGCGTGGDVTRFVELYDGIPSNDAAVMLSKTFGVAISEVGEIPPEVISKANKARKLQEQELLRQQEIKLKLKELGTMIYALDQLKEQSEPFSDTWCYSMNLLPRYTWEWDELFQKARK